MSRASAWVVRHRLGVAVSAVLLATLVVLSVLTVGGVTYGGALDPENTRPDGARAVAQVLGRHGVQVTVVRRAAELRSTRIDRDTTVLVTSSDDLGRGTARQLDIRSLAAGDLVLANPSPTLMRALRLPLVAGTVRGAGRTPAACGDPLLAGLAIDVGASVGYHGSHGSAIGGCFRAAGAPPLSLVARVERTVPTYAVGGAQLFANGRITRADNAAAALRLLGQQRRLVWYVPDPRDVAAGDAGSLRAQLPGGLGGALVLTTVAVVALILWRGRRLGPLVTEPLPVVVKAVESTQGRGRLYRRVRDRAHVAGILRHASHQRLSERLQLPRGTDPRLLVASVAGATGRDPRSVDDVLLSRPVTDDAALVRLATDLDALEREVHHP